MKNALKIIGLMVLAFVGYVAYMLINPLSPKETVGYSSENTCFEVVYSRPYKKGRLIFGSQEEGALVPFGKYWRTGANANTTFETNKDVLFGGQKLAAGKYGLFTFPYEDSWTVTLSSSNDVFFAVSQPDPKMDVLKTTALAQKLDPELEQFTIDFSQDSTSMNLNLKWDRTMVSIPIE